MFAALGLSTLCRQGAIVVALAVAPGTTVPGSVAVEGQCNKDTDCKGERLCESGRCKEAEVQGACAMGGTPDLNVRPGLSSSSATKLLQEIGKVVPVDLPPIRTGGIEFAQAMTIGRDRLIMYNPAFFLNISHWARIFVLSHELGHLVHGDVWQTDPGRKRIGEERADAFAARVLARKHSSEAQALEGVQALPWNSADGAHATVEERSRKILAEFRKERKRLANGNTCPPGHQRDGDTCRPRCRSGQFWSVDQCVDRCSSSEVWNGSRCVGRCQPSQYWNGSQCANRCRSDQRWDGARCVERCSNTQRWNGQRCVSRCTSDEDWDEDLEECIPRGLPRGAVTLACGCHGLVEIGTRRHNPDCSSGTDVVMACFGVCIFGGVQWGAQCE